MKKLNQTQLTELICLMERMKDEIIDFSHVSDLLPEELTREMNAFRSKLNKEFERRENEAIN